MMGNNQMSHLILYEHRVSCNGAQGNTYNVEARSLVAMMATEHVLFPALLISKGLGAGCASI